MNALMSQLSFLFVTVFVLATIGYVLFRQLAARVQFLEDDNRWLRTEVEHLTGTKVDTDSMSLGHVTREACGRHEHTRAWGSSECIYCGEACGDYTTAAPRDFPAARVVDASERLTLGKPERGGKR